MVTPHSLLGRFLGTTRAHCTEREGSPSLKRVRIWGVLKDHEHLAFWLIFPFSNFAIKSILLYFSALVTLRGGKVSNIKSGFSVYSQYAEPPMCREEQGQEKEPQRGVMLDYCGLGIECAAVCSLSDSFRPGVPLLHRPRLENA